MEHNWTPLSFNSSESILYKSILNNNGHTQIPTRWFLVNAGPIPSQHRGADPCFSGAEQPRLHPGSIPNLIGRHFTITGLPVLVYSWRIARVNVIPCEMICMWQRSLLVHFFLLYSMNVWLSVPRYSPVMRVFYTSCPWFVVSLLKLFVSLLFSLKSIVLIKFDDWMSRLTWFEMMWCDVWIITLLNPYNTSNPNHLTTERVVNQAVFWVASSLVQTLVVCLSLSLVQSLVGSLFFSLVHSLDQRKGETTK